MSGFLKIFKKISLYRKVISTILFIFFIWLIIVTRYDVLTEQDIHSEIFLHLDSFSVLTAFLASRSFDIGLLIAALIIPITTLIFGRYFCSWICPLGYINQILSKIRFRKKTVNFRQSNYFKYYFLIFLVFLSIFGYQIGSVFAPIPIIYRSLTLSVWPFANMIYNSFLDLLYQTDSIQFLYEPFKQVYDLIFSSEKFNLNYIPLTTIIFLIILGLNLIENRFWCNKICPFGALLGLLSRFSLFKIIQNGEACTKCSVCSKKCQGNADPDKPGELKHSECIVCGNCLDSCPKIGLHYKFAYKTIDHSFNPDRRLLIASGLISLPVLFIPDTNKTQLAYLRPPCSINEKDFIDKCIRCGICINICPNNALQLSLFETSYDGIFTPILIPRKGYCEYTCNLCTTVCPTEAIEKTPLIKKQQFTIGKARIDKSICIPYAYNSTCLVCQEHCPVPGKAIKIIDKDTIGKPVIDNKMCIGCGICEYKCPVQPNAAITVYPGKKKYIS